MAKKRKKSKSNVSLLIFALLCVVLGYVLNDIINNTYSLDFDNIIPTSKIDNPDIQSHFIDVGQGDSIFIELPNKECMLIDAGEKDAGKKVINYIKSKGYERINYLIATHPHADHIGGMKEVINSFDIGLIYMPKVTTNTSTYINLLKAIDEKELKIKSAKAGVKIIDNDNLKIDIISPNSDKYDDLNNYSAVVKLNYKDISYLYMGDAEKIVEDEIKSDVKADVIKVGHHGSSSGSSLAFLKKVNPSIAVIQVGKDNSYGHPKQTILNRFKNIGTTVYRNDINGNIIVSTDGKKIDVVTEK